MKTTLRALALVALLAAAGSFLLRQALPPRLVLRSPGQETPPEGVTIRGLVLHDGSPVEGARVRLVPAQERRGILVTSPFSVRSETDSEGRFELKGAPEGRAKLSVVSDRFAPALATIDVSSATPDVTVTLETGLAIESRVEADSTPVAGASVTVRLVGHDFAHDRRPFREVATDAEGRFRLEGFDPSRPFRLVILAEGRRPFEKSYATPQDAPARIDLETGIRMSGRVVTTAGDPVEGVELTAGQGEGYAASSRSGTSGEVEIGGLISRPVTIRAQAKGFAPARLDLPSPSSGWTLVVRRNGGVAGRAPAAAWLVIESSGATYRRSLAADGSFRWEGLPPGPAEARATDRRGVVLATRRVEIPEGSIADGILLAP
jgi:hypothetical protein